MTDTVTLQTDTTAAVDTATIDTPVVETAVDTVAVETDGDETALGGKVEEKADEPQVEAPVVPEAYELTAPEGMDLDADLVAEAAPIFKEMGLSNEAANKLMPMAGKLVEKTVSRLQEQMIDAQNVQRKAWLDGAKGAEDIGGAKWDATLRAAARGLDALGYKEGSEFRAFLNETGIGNHPDMIRIAARLGQLVGEDGDFVRADAGAEVKVPLEKRLYPND